MRRKYKLFIIIGTSILLAYFIYIFNFENKIYLVSLGDGVSSGETAYNIDGLSYSDYIKEYFDNKNLLKGYNKKFSKKNYKIKDLLIDLNNNIKENDLYIKQTIHKGNIITLCIGEDELTKLNMTKDLSEDYIKDFLKKYDILLKELKKITKGKIVVIGLYENNFLDKGRTIILNAEIANLVKKYNLTFINVEDLLLNKDYFANKNSYYFNYKGHENIAEIIINSI